MLTGGFKTRAQAENALASGCVDVVGLARALALEPGSPNLWKAGDNSLPKFPRFSESAEGGITAWYTMRLTDLGEETDHKSSGRGLLEALKEYEVRDNLRAEVWKGHFRQPSGQS